MPSYADPDALVQSGNLTDAIAAALERVRDNPTAHGERARLAVLSCLDGDLDRADRQLQTLAEQLGDKGMQVSVWRQLVRAAVAREDLFNANRPPEFSVEPSEQVQMHLRALVELSAGQVQDAATLLADAEGLIPAISGTHAEQPFQGIRDLDDVLAPVLEILASNGSYYWVPFSSLRRISPEPIATHWDVLWRPATIELRNGSTGQVFLPSCYYSPGASLDDQLKLGRSTDWIEQDGVLTRGVGQKMLLVGDDAVPVLELGEIVFEASDGSE